MARRPFGKLGASSGPKQSRRPNDIRAAVSLFQRLLGTPYRSSSGSRVATLPMPGGGQSPVR